LRQYAEQRTVDLFPENSGDVHLSDQATYELLQQREESLLTLKPANTRDQWWLGQAMTLAGKIGDTRWLVAQQVPTSVLPPLGRCKCHLLRGRYPIRR
jgi:hypothetical protein